jgi:flagellar motor protein MotB
LKSNKYLSTKRANNVAKELIKFGVPKNKIAIIEGFANKYHREKGRVNNNKNSQNRRVEIEVVGVYY